MKKSDEPLTARVWAVHCPNVSKFDAQLDTALGTLGFARASGEGATRLYRSESPDDIELTFVSGDETLRSLPKALARALGAPVRLHEAEATDDPDNQDDTVDALFETSEVRPDGSVVAIEREESEVDRSANLADALAQALWAGNDASKPWSPVDPVEVIAESSTLPSRLKHLVRDIRTAGAWTLAVTGGRATVRIVLPDGSRRISMLTESELATVEAAVGIEPTRA